MSGTAATATSTAALCLAALAEGKGAFQPLNATSHWLYGDEAADFRRAGLDPTVVGCGTHYAATIFWAVCFETALTIRPTREPVALGARAVTISALAAMVDYTITPKRFTPGWELVLRKRSMALAYLAMAIGFAGAAWRWPRPR